MNSAARKIAKYNRPFGKSKGIVRIDGTKQQLEKHIHPRHKRSTSKK